MLNSLDKIRLNQASQLFKESSGDKSINGKEFTFIKDEDIRPLIIFSTSKSI